MKCAEARQNKQRLDALFSQISNFSGDIELQSHWARYLCVLVSAFLETSVLAVYSEYASKRAKPDVASFVRSRLKGFQNPNMNKILDLTGAFNPEWKTQLRAATEGEPKEAVDSIVANRNKVAHGESVGITYSRIQGYYTNAVKVIELIDKQCNG